MARLREEAEGDFMLKHYEILCKFQYDTEPYIYRRDLSALDVEMLYRQIRGAVNKKFVQFDNILINVDQLQYMTIKEIPPTVVRSTSNGE